MPAQFVDPHVSRSKFDREIAAFRSLEETYRKRGWFLVHADFPKAVVVLATPQLSPPAVLFGVAFDYANYDAQPPSVQLVNPFTLIPYRQKELPTDLPRSSQPVELPIPGLPGSPQVHTVQPLMQAHGPEEIPFLCLAGVREYHEHPGHTGDSWELHRAGGAGRLVRLLEIIHKYGVEPITGYGVQLIPQIRFQQGQPPA